MKAKERGTRTGFTTGACAAAAARAATLSLVEGKVPACIDCQLPNEQIVQFEIIDGRMTDISAHTVVVKDAGDDPDCTDGAHLTVDVRLLPNRSDEVILKGGDGVGLITLPGLGLTVDGPAINPVPRKNIEFNVRAVGESLLVENGLEVTISVPEGEQMAKKTLNARLGIIGGISILGTTGIVRPYSTAAYRASVVQGIQVAASQGCDTVVLTTGGRTEKFVMRELPDLSEAAFVQMGDFLSYALDTAVQESIEHVVIGGMVGKLTKMAQGETITHAGRNAVNTGLLADLCKGLGVADDVCDDIKAAPTARYAAERMEALDLVDEFHFALAQAVVNTLVARYPKQFSLRVLVCDFDGNKIADASGNV